MDNKMDNKMDTKEQAKKKALIFLCEKFDEYAEIIELHNDFRVRWQIDTGYKSEKFPFIEPKLGDMAWCSDDNDSDPYMLLCYYNGNGWCQRKHSATIKGNGSNFDNIELLGINIADKLDSSGTEG